MLRQIDLFPVPVAYFCGNYFFFSRCQSGLFEQALKNAGVIYYDGEKGRNYYKYSIDILGLAGYKVKKETNDYLVFKDSKIVHTYNEPLIPYENKFLQQLIKNNEIYIDYYGKGALIFNTIYASIYNENWPDYQHFEGMVSNYYHYENEVTQIERNKLTSQEKEYLASLPELIKQSRFYDGELSWFKYNVLKIINSITGMFSFF